MPNPIVNAGGLAILVMGLAFLGFRMILGKRRGYNWQPDLEYRVQELDMSMRQNHSAVWLTEKSAEERYDERREYLRERVKND